MRRTNCIWEITFSIKVEEKNYFSNLEHAKTSGCCCKMGIDCCSGKYTVGISWNLTPVAGTWNFLRCWAACTELARQEMLMLFYVSEETPKGIDPSVLQEKWESFRQSLYTKKGLHWMHCYRKQILVGWLNEEYKEQWSQKDVLVMSVKQKLFLSLIKGQVSIFSWKAKIWI